MTQSEQNDGTSDEDVLKRIRARFQAGMEAESDIRRDAMEDLKFFGGDQWPEDIRNQREQDQRPCLTINRLPQFVRQVTNEIRQNRPAIKVSPVDDKGDVDTAEVIQGLIRHIEYESNAEIAYDTACDYQVRCGFGYFRIITEYCDPMSFQQKICIRPIRDPFAVVMDPNATLPDGSDSEWCFIQDTMSPDAFKVAFPEAELTSMSDWAAVGRSSSAGWCDSNSVRVAEYYEKTFERKTIFQMSDGTVVERSEISDETFAILTGKAPRPDGIELPTIAQKRDTVVPKVMWYKTNGLEILDKTEIFGEFIPVLPVIGDELYVNGKRQLESVVRHAKDPQRMYNFWETAKTEMIALAPKAPFIGAEGQFDGFETEWQQANVKMHPFLQYKKVVDGAGNALPPPMRQQYEPPIQALVAASGQAAEDMKTTTGIYDSELGNRSNENSGIAILRRTQQSNTSNFHYGDNLKRSICHGGRIITQWIPFVYDGPQAVRVLGEDNQQKIVQINQIFMKNGKKTVYDLDKGEYDVTVDTGPSFQTKRQEASQAMLELTKALPEQMKFAADLLVSNFDWPGARTIAERIRKTLPPGIAEIDGDEKQPVPPEAQAQLQQMSQMLEQQSQLIKQQDEAIRTEKVKTESKERIELQKMRNDLVIEMMKHDAAHAQLGFKMELQSIDRRMDLVDKAMEQVSNAGQPAQMNQPPGGPPPAQ